MGNHKIVVDGVTKDLQDDYSVSVTSSAGMGIPPANNLNTELALQPGALIEGQTYQARVMTWNCSIEGTTQADFHDKRQAFIKALDTQTGKINARPTGIEVQYTGATVDKKINVVYDGGLEGNNWNQAFQEDFALRLRADDPIWKSTATATTTALDEEDSATFRLVAKREGDASVPIWNELGPPNASGTYTDVQALAQDATYLYIGGNFTNFDNIANADYIVRMNKSTGTYTAMGSGMNGAVKGITVTADGTVYAAGAFTTAGGGGANYIASWNGSAWSALGTGFNAEAYVSLEGNDGTIYVGGNFTTAGGSSANYIATWDGSSWGTLGTGFNAYVRSLVMDGNDLLYLGGNFTTASGATANRIATWDGSSYTTLGTGLDNTVRGIALTDDRMLYATGSFLNAGGSSANRIAIWNGSSWSPLGLGLGGTGEKVILSTDNTVYVVGSFSSASNNKITGLDGIAIWNGSEWSRLDVALPSAAITYDAILDDGDLYVGFDSTGTGTFSGDLTIAYAGTAKSYPQVTINRDGGTHAYVRSLRNETTGAILSFYDYDVLDGETLTLEFDQREGAFMTSSVRGNIYSSLIPSSDFGAFYLTPGNGTGTNDNVITLHVIGAGGATITANIIYTINYISAD